MALSCDIGDVVRLTCVFSQSSVNVDPTTVSLKVEAPDGTSTTYTYVGTTITRSAAGTYYVDVSPTQAGDYHYRWFSTSNGAGAAESRFQVRSQRVT